MPVVEFTFPGDRIRPLPQLLHGSRSGRPGLSAGAAVRRPASADVRGGAGCLAPRRVDQRPHVLRGRSAGRSARARGVRRVGIGFMAPEQQVTSRNASPALLALWRLHRSEPVILVAAAASLRYGTPAGRFDERLMAVGIGDVVALPEFAAALVGRGYRRRSMVEGQGEFAVRGGILDVFSPAQPQPWRLEFFGDEVETIRTFDVYSQLSVEALDRIVIAPLHWLPPQNSEAAPGWERLRSHLQACEWSESRIDAQLRTLATAASGGVAVGDWTVFFVEGLRSPLADLPETVDLCCVDAEDVRITLEQLPAPPPLQLGDTAVAAARDQFVSGDTLNRQLRERTDLALPRYHGVDRANGWGANGSEQRQSAPSGEVTELRMHGTPTFAGDLGRFVAQLRQWHDKRYGVLVCCRSAPEVRRLQDALSSYDDLGCGVAETAAQCLAGDAVPPGSTLLAPGTLSRGFEWPDERLVVVGAGDLFGDKHRAAAAPAGSGKGMSFVATLRPGDLVVHTDHGIGRFDGMKFLDVDRQGGEFMEVTYADDAKLYVPSYRLSQVGKFLNGSGEVAKTSLDRLGTTSWARTKARVKGALLDMAGELVDLHASRQQDVGHRFSPSTTLHQEFENDFEYVETDDQLLAIQDVLGDMERPRPMERLVCGDVGYGKTEVALRAAFKAVFDGKQVAVLVPTTVLAQQHAETFRKRFEGFGTRLATLSRLNSRKEQTRTLKGLGDGTVDIVVGTHRLLQKDIRFKDLGLLVVDEEHRFGVGHKERIKSLSVGTDVLILTATPIPRSLQMALSGLRDCTIMETPPGGRSAIETVIMPFSEHLVERAVRQETGQAGTGLLRAQSHRQPAGRPFHAETAGTRVPGSHRPRADAGAPAGGRHAGLPAARLRPAAVHHDHRVGPGHPVGEHHHRQQCGPFRPGADAPAAGSRGAGPDAGLRLPAHPRRDPAFRGCTAAHRGAGGVFAAGLRFPPGLPRPGNPRRRQPARTAAVRPHEQRGIRPVLPDDGGGGQRGQGGGGRRMGGTRTQARRPGAHSGELRRRRGAAPATIQAAVGGDEQCGLAGAAQRDAGPLRDAARTDATPAGSAGDQDTGAPPGP